MGDVAVELWRIDKNREGYWFPAEWVVVFCWKQGVHLPELFDRLRSDRRLQEEFDRAALEAMLAHQLWQQFRR